MKHGTMDLPGSSCPASAGIPSVEIVFDDPAWRRVIPGAARLAACAVRAAYDGTATVVLSTDRAVRAPPERVRDRGRNKPTNVLTYPASAPSLPGEIVLGLGGKSGSEAAAASRPISGAPPDLHLVDEHGALHLAGHDHRTTPARPASDGNWPKRASCTGCACPIRGNAHERTPTSAAAPAGLAAQAARRNLQPARVDRRTDVLEAAGRAADPGVSPPELDRHERVLINNILRLREILGADDVMIPRADIISIRADVTLTQAIDGRSASRAILACLVYREQLDDIIGMIHVKDVFAYVVPAGGVRDRGDPAPPADGNSRWPRRSRGARPAGADAARRHMQLLWRWWWTNTVASTGW